MERPNNPPNSGDGKARDTPFKVALLGASFDVGNMGVRALAASVVQLIFDARPEAKIQLFYGNRTGGDVEVELASGTVPIEIVNYRLSPKARFKEHLALIFAMACLARLTPFRSLRKRLIDSIPFLKKLSEADFVGDIRGGDSFSDIYGMRLFIINAMPAIVAILLGKRLVLLPQTYGPFQSGAARAITRYICSNSSRIYARDLQSKSLLQELLGTKGDQETVRLCPDVAFTLQPKPAAPLFDPPLIPEMREPLIGFNVSGLLYMGGYTRNNMFNLQFDYKEFTQTLLLRFLEQTPARILIIPHVFGTDAEGEPEACEEVWRSVPSRFRDRVHILRGEYDQSEIKSVIGRCDFFLGARMHACIAGLSQNIPTVGLAYSQKFLGVFESAGAGDMVLDCRKIQMDDLIRECLHRFETRASMTASLAEKIPQIQDEVRGWFTEELTGQPRQKKLPVERQNGVSVGSCC